MARPAQSKGGTSKVRLVVFEAEVSDGDLSQFTQAIQNALQPRAATTRIVHTSLPAALPAAVIDDEDGDLVDQGGTTIDSPAPKPRAERNAKPKQVRTPVVLKDLDAKTDPALADFVKQFDLKTTFEKYLVVALWFREAREIEAIGIDHVYTCFRLLDWPTGSTDFEKPFRNLRTNQWVTGGSKEGFTLTLTGADKIEKKKVKS